MVSNLALFCLATVLAIFQKNWAIFSKSSGHPGDESHFVFVILNVVALGVVMLNVVILSGVGLNVVAPTTYKMRGKLFHGKKFFHRCNCSINEPNYHYEATTKLYFQQFYILEE
jgi:hypothetical protein